MGFFERFRKWLLTEPKVLQKPEFPLYRVKPDLRAGLVRKSDLQAGLVWKPVDEFLLAYRAFEQVRAELLSDEVMHRVLAPDACLPFFARMVALTRLHQDFPIDPYDDRMIIAAGRCVVRGSTVQAAAVDLDSYFDLLEKEHV